MLLCLSAAAYAVSLAAIAGQQSDADAALAVARRPAIDQVAAAAARADILEARLGAAEAGVRDLAAAYGGVGSDVDTLAARLDRLAALVTEVEGSAAALPARIHLPTVSVRSVPVAGGGTTTRAPRTHGRSGASGG
jgi:hypothetical protein